MQFEKCKICRQPFQSYGSRVCPACQEQLDKDFFTVRDYIYDNPHSTSIEKIVEATGVEEKRVMYLLEDGRLSMGGMTIGGIGAQMESKCQLCGKPVMPGNKLCDGCKTSLSKEFSSAFGGESKKPANSSYVSPRSSRSDDK